VGRASRDAEEFEAELKVALSQDGIDSGRFQFLGEGKDGGSDVAVTRTCRPSRSTSRRCAIVSGSARQRSSLLTLG
jgi:hypothetical protein